MKDSTVNTNFVSKIPMRQTKWKTHRAKLDISLAASHS